MPIPCSPEITPPSSRATAMMRATARAGRLQHFIVVGIDGNIGMHVAVAGVHVQGDEHAALEHACVDRVALL